MYLLQGVNKPFMDVDFDDLSERPVYLSVPQVYQEKFVSEFSANLFSKLQQPGPAGMHPMEVLHTRIQEAARNAQVVQVVLTPLRILYMILKSELPADVRFNNDELSVVAELSSRVLTAGKSSEDFQISEDERNLFLKLFEFFYVSRPDLRAKIKFFFEKAEKIDTVG